MLCGPIVNVQMELSDVATCMRQEGVSDDSIRMFLEVSMRIAKLQVDTMAVSCV